MQCAFTNAARWPVFNLDCLSGLKMSPETIIARIISPVEISLKGHQVDDHIICDRNLLSEQSLFFKNLFCSPLESGRNEFEIKDLSFDNLKRVVNFVTTSQINLDGDNLLELLSVSIYLAVPSLEELCKQHLISHADPQDYCIIFKFANQNRLPEFSSQILTLIHKHAPEVLVERSFLECDVDEIISIIESDDLEVENEEICWRAVREWYAHDSTNRQADFIRLLELVRFPLAQESVLAEIARYCQKQEFFERTVTPFLDNALEMRKDPHRAFEISHPKYHFRTNGIQRGLIVFNDSEVTTIPFGPQEGPVAGSSCWRSDIVPDLVGLFDPVNQQTKWLHEVPKNVRPKFACQSQAGDLFISTTSYNPYVPNDRILKYCLERDSWDVVIEAGLGYVKGMCILDRFLHVFYVGRDLMPPTFMTRRDISISAAPEVPSEILPFQFTYGTRCIVHGSFIYVLGCGSYGIKADLGRQVFRFVPEIHTWNRKSDCPIDISILDQVCAHSDGLIYTMTIKRETGQWLSHMWSYDSARDFWSILPVLTRNSILRPMGIFAWNDKLLIKDRFRCYEMQRGYEQLRDATAALVLSCPHDISWMCCHTCRNSMNRIEVYDPPTNKIVNSWVLGSRETGESECGNGGTVYRIRKSALRDRKDDVRVVKIGNEPGVPITLEEQKEQLRNHPPVIHLFNALFNI